MEKVKSKGLVFRITFGVFLLTFLFYVFFELNGSAVPSLDELFKAIFQPFELAYNPFPDLIDSLQAIKDFVSSGDLPTLENLLDLFFAPFRLVGNIVTVFFQIISNIVELFS